MLTVAIDRHHQIGTRVERATESVLNQFCEGQSSVSPRDERKSDRFGYLGNSSIDDVTGSDTQKHRLHFHATRRQIESGLVESDYRPLRRSETVHRRHKHRALHLRDVSQSCHSTRLPRTFEPWTTNLSNQPFRALVERAGRARGPLREGSLNCKFDGGAMRDEGIMKATVMSAILVVGLVVMSGCTSSGRALDDQRIPAALLGPESAETGQDSLLSNALDAADVNLAGAPETKEASNADVRGCLLDAQAAKTPAVLVDIGTTTEGDPIVAVWRVLSDGTVAVFTDASRDSFGPASKGWTLERCERLETKNATLGFTIPGNRFYCA